MQELLEGLMLPAIFRNYIPNAAVNLKLRNYRKKIHVVRLSRLPNHLLHLGGKNWKSLIQSIEYPNIKKMSFNWVKENKFKVAFINNEGLEKRKPRLEPEYVHTCLITATDETIIKQELPKLLLADFNNRYRKTENLVGTIKGPRQNNKVDVFYVYDEDQRVGHAKGFYGNKWTNFCFENDIEAGQTLLFINERNKIFTLKIFNSDGILLQMEPSGDLNSPSYPHISGENMEHEEEHNVLRSNHKCTLLDHDHETDLPHFFKKIEHFIILQNRLTIPKYLVRMFDLYEYKTARLNFGTLTFRVILEVHPDPRTPNDQTHVAIITDWITLLQQTGFAEGKIIRFQLNLEDLLEGNFLEFDIC